MVFDLSLDMVLPMDKEEHTGLRIVVNKGGSLALFVAYMCRAGVKIGVNCAARYLKYLTS